MIQYTIEQLSQAIKDSFSWAEVLRKLSFKSGGSQKNVQKKADNNKLDYSHFTGQLWNKDKKLGAKIDLQIYLNNEKPIHSSGLRERLIKEGYKEHKCEKCNLNKWLEKLINIELHHIDGNNKNNNLSNLEILCPNCHSYTETFCGKNKANKKKRVFATDEQIIEAIKTTYCRRQALLKLGLVGYGGNYERINEVIEKYNPSFMEKPKTKDQIDREKLIKEIEAQYNDPNFKPKNKDCKADPEWRTRPKPQYRKVERPSRDELIRMVYDKPMVIIAKELGVCDHSIRNWLRWYGIEIPAHLTRGYWRKVHCRKIPKIPCPI